MEVNANYKPEEVALSDYYVIIDDTDIVKNAKVYGLASSVKRSKYPYAVDLEKANCVLTKTATNLAQSPKGEGHDNYLNGVTVQFDLKFTNKAWVEAERYHFLDFVSSQSTMHRITKFDLDAAYIEYVDQRIVDIVKGKVIEYNALAERIEKLKKGEDTAENPVCVIMAMENQLRNLYLQILYSNPAGFQITAGMTTNYRQLKTIYAQRKNHRLPEWRAFCAWIETLPASHLITCDKVQ